MDQIKQYFKKTLFTSQILLVSRTLMRRFLVPKFLTQSYCLVSEECTTIYGSFVVLCGHLEFAAPVLIYFLPFKSLESLSFVFKKLILLFWLQVCWGPLVENHCSNVTNDSLNILKNCCSSELSMHQRQKKRKETKYNIWIQFSFLKY